METTSQPGRRIATVKEAAALWKITPRTLLRLADDGLFPLYRVGERVVRVDLDDLESAFTPAPEDVHPDHGNVGGGA